MKKFIAVAGNMGVGKTSFVEFLSEEFGFEPAYEPYADNPWLDEFYGDMGRWAYPSQIWFLTNKFRLHLDLNQKPGTVVQDRTIYMDLYGGMKRTLQPPDLMIYLRCSVRAIRRRIQKRGRASEMAIPTKYLQGLNGLYENWMENYDLSPKVVWDSERADYLTHIVDRLEFRKMLKPFL